MRKFWGFYDNGKYRVGCNGGMLFVYDENNTELARLKSIRYGYSGAFKPNTNIFVVKSTGGSLAVFDLDKQELCLKIPVTDIGAVDEGFGFSPNGKYFYNIEKTKNSCETQLIIYNADDFKPIKTLFADEKNMCLETLEFDDETDEVYILGFMRDEESEVIDYGFIGKLRADKIVEKKIFDCEIYDYIQAYKNWELQGFTEKSLEWSTLKEYSEIVPVTLKDVYEKI